MKTMILATILSLVIGGAIAAPLDQPAPQQSGTPSSWTVAGGAGWG